MNTHDMPNGFADGEASAQNMNLNPASDMASAADSNPGIADSTTHTTHTTHMTAPENNDSLAAGEDSAQNMNLNPAADMVSAADSTSTDNQIAPMSEDENEEIVVVSEMNHERTGNYVYPDVNDTFEVPEGGCIATCYLEVDDWGSMTISGPGGTYELKLDESTGTANPDGGHARWSNEVDFTLEAGRYTYTIRHRNIVMHYPDNNLAVFNYSIVLKPIPDSSSSSSSSSSSVIPPDPSSSSSSSNGVPPKDEEICCTPCCSCADEEGNEYTVGLENLPDDVLNGSRCISKAEFEKLTNSSPKSRMTTPASEGESVTACGGLRYDSPWAWTSEYDAETGTITIMPPSGYALYFTTQEGSDVALPAGITRKRDLRVQLLDADFNACSTGSPAYFALVEASGRKVQFNAQTGAVYAIRTPEGQYVKAEDHDAKVKNIRDINGNLVSSYSAEQGLMQTRTGSAGELIMEWFAPAAVTVNEDGSYTTTGTPYKSSTYASSEEDGITTTIITRQQRDLPEYVLTRREEPGKVTISKGTGDDTIIRTIETHDLVDNMVERIESIRGINDVDPVSCNRSVKQYSAGGWLLVSETEAFNTPVARTTTYEYNADFKLSRVNRPDGGYTRYEYDSNGRVCLEASPWAGGQEKITRTTYSNGRFYDNRPAIVTESYVQADGVEVTMTTTTYAYEDSGSVERVTKTVTAAGSNLHQVSIEETYGESAANYAAGKVKLSQDINGVQTRHVYEPTTEHGAVYKHTITTEVNGAYVDAMSRKTEEFIALNETTVFEQEFIYSAESGWLLLSSATHEYDEQLRLIKTTRGNGRVSTASWMCCGKLSETNEDGITTTYGYDSAHRLVETIRDEVCDGETVITPETITTYVKDAADRTLQTRRDVGAMTTTESSVYDQLGRVVSQTDILGRTTLTRYSEDGLTTSQFLPTAASLITTRNTDGSTAHVYGTGQQEFYHVYDISNNRLRETVKLGNQSTTVSQVLANGFGQTVVQTTAVPGGFVYDRSEYNAKGQLVRSWRDTGSHADAQSTAPTLYEYDSFGNMVKQTLLLDDEAADDVTKNRITLQAFAVENLEDGVYSIASATRYTVAGNSLNQTKKEMLSQFSAIVENKTLSINERNLTSTQWVEYSGGTKRVQKQTIPTSNIIAETVTVDGFVVLQKDNVGITATQARAYTTTGMTLTQVDGRGNSMTTATDLSGRTLTVTDAMGNVTTTTYCADSDNPDTITNAQGKTASYAYDFRGRKVAEFGTAIQPACFGYDDADRLVSLTTFRANDGDITTDPRNRADGDCTRWAYDEASGLELVKTYADGTQSTKSYGVFGNITSETNVRGIAKVMSYDTATGQLISITYSDDTTPSQTFAYNVQGQMTQVTDAAGTRTFTYNEFGERVTDSLVVDDETHLITENRDEFGRSAGFTYSEADGAFGGEQYGYGSDGRLATAAFLHNGESKQFEYSYIPGTHLLQTLTMPNNMTLTQQFETQRDLLTGMEYQRGETSVVERYYTYDTLGRPLTRQHNRQGGSRSDSFTHNDRSELTAGILGTKGYYYTYDNIGNRKTAKEDADEATNYDANALNQYTAVGDFVPEFDADGNQTKVQTCTGIWNVTYNAENRPVTFDRSNADGTTTRVTCAYDYMGRRTTKKVETVSVSDTETGESTTTTILHQRYIYRGYLQIAGFDLTESGHAFRWFITWDPTQTVASRPLAIRKDGTWYCYGWDLTKNVCEVFSNIGTISNTVIYSYTPYGAVTAEGSVSQPIQWSSEFYDDELGLVYYNYRHYNSKDGRWLGRDPMPDIPCMEYSYVDNLPILDVDILGMYILPFIGKGFLINPGTFELSVPIGFSGLDWFINITVEKSDCNCNQKISIAGGSSWDLRNYFPGPIKKALERVHLLKKLPEVRFAVYAEGEFSAACGNIDFCVLSGNASLTLGNGRRGGNSKYKFKGWEDKSSRGWSYFSAGLEGKIGYNFCTRQVEGELMAVLSVNVSKEIFNMDFSYNDVVEIRLL